MEVESRQCVPEAPTLTPMMKSAKSKFKLPTFATSPKPAAAASAASEGNPTAQTDCSGSIDQETTAPQPVVRFSLILPVKASAFSAEVQAALLDSIAQVAQVAGSHVRLAGANVVHKIDKKRSKESLVGKLKTEAVQCHLLVQATDLDTANEVAERVQDSASINARLASLTDCSMHTVGDDGFGSCCVKINAVPAQQSNNGSSETRVSRCPWLTRAQHACSACPLFAQISCRRLLTRLMILSDRSEEHGVSARTSNLGTSSDCGAGCRVRVAASQV